MTQFKLTESNILNKYLKQLVPVGRFFFLKLYFSSHFKHCSVLLCLLCRPPLRRAFKKGMCRANTGVGKMSQDFSVGCRSSESPEHVDVHSN